MYASARNKHFSLNLVIIRPTKIMNRADIFFGKIQPIFNTKNDFESTNFEMFEEVVHNFGKSDDDKI